MSEATLFAIGCGVTFIFLAGAYVAYRASFSAERPRNQTTPVGRS